MHNIILYKSVCTHNCIIYISVRQFSYFIEQKITHINANINAKLI